MGNLKTFKSFINETIEDDLGKESYTGHFYVLNKYGNVESDFTDNCIAKSQEEAEEILLGRNGTYSKGQDKVVKVDYIKKSSAFTNESKNRVNEGFELDEKIEDFLYNNRYVRSKADAVDLAADIVEIVASKNVDELAKALQDYWSSVYDKNTDYDECFQKAQYLLKEVV